MFKSSLGTIYWPVALLLFFPNQATGIPPCLVSKVFGKTIVKLAATILFLFLLSYFFPSATFLFTTLPNSCSAATYLYHLAMIFWVLPNQYFRLRNTFIILDMYLGYKSSGAGSSTLNPNVNPNASTSNFPTACSGIPTSAFDFPS